MATTATAPTSSPPKSSIRGKIIILSLINLVGLVVWLVIHLTYSGKSDGSGNAGSPAPVYNPQLKYCPGHLPYDEKLDDRQKDPPPIQIQLQDGCYGDRRILSFRWSDVIPQFDNPQPGDYVTVWCTQHSRPSKIFTPDSNLQELATYLKEECVIPEIRDGAGNVIQSKGVSIDFSPQGRGTFVLTPQDYRAPPLSQSLFPSS